MPNVKDLLRKIESGDISYEEKLAALSQVEASLQELKAKKEERVKFNVQLIIDEIKKVKQDVQVQLDYARSIVPERGPKGDQGERGVDGAPGRNGVDGRDGRDGKDGQDGQDGVSVTGAKIDFDGSLIITLSTGREINVGEVVAADLAEKIRVTMSTNSTVAIQDEGSTITSGVRNINFTGSGITATASGDSVTVNVSGGGSPFTTPVEINVDSASSALTINQIGAGNALLVEDSANPDSTPTVIDASGNLILGKTSRQSAVVNGIESHSTNSGSSGLNAPIAIYNWSSSTVSTAGPWLSFFRYPSGTVGTTAFARDNDLLGGIQFFGQQSTGSLFSGSIRGRVASDLVSVNMFYIGASHSFTGPITSGTWNGTAIGIAYGGTGATTRQDAMDALAGAVTSGQYLRGDGTDVVMSAIQAADVPTLNQNTTGTAAGLSATLAVGSGGTGQTTYTDGQLLIGNSSGNTLTKSTLTAGSGVTIANANGSITISATGSGGTVTSVTGSSPVVSSGGTTPAISLAANYGDTLNPYASKTANFILAAPDGAAGAPTFRGLVAADVPTLNQNTTGNAATATTATNVSGGLVSSSRINPRASSTTSTSSITPDISSFDQYAVTAQAATLTINAPTGTPVDGNKLIFRILDNGTSQTLSWNATYTVIGVTLPTTTTINKMTYVGCIYNAANTRWDVIAVTTQA
jgi:hypothetical protein